MPIKNLLHRFQPTQLYVVLVLSICYFSVQLVLSHITHALTLLMASYHMLCNIFALTGCIVTIKHSKRKPNCRERSISFGGKSNNSNRISTIQIDGNDQEIVVKMGENEESSLTKRARREMKLRNTFGWTRIDILTMLIVCIILASLSFSLLVEALQTLVHIDHQDTMHLPIEVMVVGLLGLLLNGATYLLIGGYTMHQGSFLHVTPTGEVVLDRAMSNSTESALKPNERQLSKSRKNKQLRDELQSELGRSPYYTTKRQGAVEMFRDVSSTIFVIVSGLIVYMANDEEHTSKLIDPVLSIFSCVLLVSLSYPYMKESCLILLQTIPGSIDMEIFESTLSSKFPQIHSYHDLHIWQLSAQKYVATIHIKFRSPRSYIKIIEDVRAYFHEQGISEITIQPEFHCPKTTPSLECLVQCNASECAEKVCCKGSRSDLSDVKICSIDDREYNRNHNHQGTINTYENNQSHKHQYKNSTHRYTNAKPSELKVVDLLKSHQDTADVQSKPIVEQHVDVLQTTFSDNIVVNTDNVDILKEKCPRKQTQPPTDTVRSASDENCMYQERL